jgi:hypothetical protein
MNTRKAFLLLAAAAVGTTAYADKVAFKDAPLAVQKAIRSRSARQRIEDIDRDVRAGQTNYEASWKTPAGAQQELLLSADGAILRDVTNSVALTTATAPQGTGSLAAGIAQTNSVTGFTGAQQAPLNWASETVQNQFKTMANGAPIENFQKGQFQGRTAFMGTFQKDGQTKTVVMGEDGTVLNLSPNPANAIATTTAPTAGASIAGFTGGQSAPLNWASETAQNKFKALANGAAVQNFQKGQFQGRTAYMGTFLQNGRPASVVIADDGTILSSTPGLNTAVGGPATGVTGTGQK